LRKPEEQKSEDRENQRVSVELVHDGISSDDFNVVRGGRRSFLTCIMDSEMGDSLLGTFL
jgi:hypothetical protein